MRERKKERDIPSSSPIVLGKKNIMIAFRANNKELAWNLISRAVEQNSLPQRGKTNIKRVEFFFVANAFSRSIKEQTSLKYLFATTTVCVDKKLKQISAVHYINYIH